MNESRRVLCDWGSSRLRAYLDIQGTVTDRRDGPGIGRLGTDSPAEVLPHVLAPWRDGRRLEVFVCGMVGSRNGLAEVPYLRAPASIEAWRRGGLRVRVEDLEVSIAPGIQADNLCGLPDVMRGEETQIFGALALERQLAAGRHLVVLPGTHSKWVRVRDGAVTRVQTYLTGELFDLLSQYSSLLRVAGDPATDDGSFEEGLRAVARNGLAASLFQTRVAQLIEARTAGSARAFLSGLLIGAEVGSMLDMDASAAEPLTLIGDPDLTALYSRALAAHYVSAQALDGELCALTGLRALAGTMQDS